MILEMDYFGELAIRDDFINGAENTVELLGGLIKSANGG